MAVVLTPTRNFASNIHKEAEKFAFNSYIRPCVVQVSLNVILKTENFLWCLYKLCRYGDVDFQKQCENLDRGCHLLVATPGRLVSLLKQRKISLEKCRFVNQKFCEEGKITNLILLQMFGVGWSWQNVGFGIWITNSFHNQKTLRD